MHAWYFIDTVVYGTTTCGDGSIDAYTPTLTYATRVVSIVTIIFMVLIVIIFWLGTIKKGRGKKEPGGNGGGY